MSDQDTPKSKISASKIGAELDRVLNLGNQTYPSLSVEAEDLGEITPGYDKLKENTPIHSIHTPQVQRKSQLSENFGDEAKRYMDQEKKFTIQPVDDDEIDKDEFRDTVITIGYHNKSHRKITKAPILDTLEEEMVRCTESQGGNSINAEFKESESRGSLNMQKILSVDETTKKLKRSIQTRKLQSKFPKKKVEDILKVLPMFSSLDPQFQKYIFDQVQVEAYINDDVINMEDPDSAIDFIYIAQGALQVELQSIEKLISATKSQKSSPQSTIDLTSLKSMVNQKVGAGVDTFRMKADEFLDQSDIRKQESKVVRGTLGADLLGAFSQLNHLVIAARDKKRAESLAESARNSVSENVSQSGHGSQDGSQLNKPKVDPDAGMSNLSLKIRKHTLNMVQGRSQQRNPFFFRKIVKFQAEGNTVILRIPDHILQTFGTLRQSYVARKNPWSAINVKAGLEKIFAELMVNNGDTRIIKMLLNMFKVKIYQKKELIFEEGYLPENISLIMQGDIQVYRRLGSLNHKYDDRDQWSLTVAQKEVMRSYGEELFKMNVLPIEPFLLSDDTLLNGRESTFSVITQSPVIVMQANMQQFMKACLEVGPRAIQIMKRVAAEKVNMVTKHLVNKKENNAVAKQEGLDFRSVEQMIRDTSTGVESTKGHRMHSLINRENVKSFANANKNLKTKLHHSFHDKSKVGEFVNFNKNMVKTPLTGKVSYEDVVKLEQLKNDIFIDDVVVQKRRDQNKKVEKSYKQEIQRKRELFTGLTHRKNQLNYSTNPKSYQLIGKEAMRQATLEELKSTREHPNGKSVEMDQDEIPLSFSRTAKQGNDMQEHKSEQFYEFKSTPKSILQESFVNKYHAVLKLKEERAQVQAKKNAQERQSQSYKSCDLSPAARIMHLARQEVEEEKVQAVVREFNGPLRKNMKYLMKVESTRNSIQKSKNYMVSQSVERAANLSISLNEPQLIKYGTQHTSLVPPAETTAGGGSQYDEPNIRSMRTLPTYMVQPQTQRAAGAHLINRSMAPQDLKALLNNNSFKDLNNAQSINTEQAKQFNVDELKTPQKKQRANDPFTLPQIYNSVSHGSQQQSPMGRYMPNTQRDNRISQIEKRTAHNNHMVANSFSASSKAARMKNSNQGTETHRIYFDSLCNVDGLYGDRHVYKKPQAKLLHK